MTEEQDDFELERGTGNVFADAGLPDAEREQLRAVLAAEIGKSLADDSLSVRDAERMTGFTIDRLMTILDKLNRDVRVSVSAMPRKLTVQSHFPL